MQLNSRLYYDSKSANASVYVQNMRHFYLYDEGQNTLIMSDVFAGPTCDFENAPIKGAPQWNAIATADTSAMTPLEVLALITKHFNVAIDSITNSTTTAIISGDCQKVFGDGFSIPSIPQEYITFPVYDELVLEQIRNTTIIPANSVAGTSLIQPLTSNPTGSTVPALQVQTHFYIPDEFGYGTAPYACTNGCICQDPKKGTITQNLIFSILPCLDVHPGAATSDR